jgi:exopolyphosphatase/guanosine-5'-triphosphate,3'-diphosphate pyrophosphatase
MEPIRRAVIDVGTNSVKLLVAEVAGHEVRPLREESRQTRLGRGFYETRRLQAPAIATTARAVAEFAALARECAAASVRVIATSAARDALNPEDLAHAIEEAAGLKMEIISGEREADWVFQGVTTDPRLADEPLLLLDVGGGSTEFILGQGEEKHFRQSFALGTVRLLETLPPADPPKAEELAACRRWLKDFLEREVRPRLEPGLQREAGKGSGKSTIRLGATGGTASVLACMDARLETFDRARIEGARLSFERLRELVVQLWSLPLEQRKQIAGLPANRADVILMGAAIFEAIMEQFGFDELRISTRGLRFAAVMSAARDEKIGV